MKTKYDSHIVEAVADYRRASAGFRAHRKSAFSMMMDRASGQIDLLFKLAPKSDAWSETKWIF